MAKTQFLQVFALIIKWEDTRLDLAKKETTYSMQRTVSVRNNTQTNSVESSLKQHPLWVQPFKLFKKILANKYLNILCVFLRKNLEKEQKRRIQTTTNNFYILIFLYDSLQLLSLSLPNYFVQLQNTLFWQDPEMVLI